MSLRTTSADGCCAKEVILPSYPARGAHIYELGSYSPSESVLYKVQTKKNKN